MNTHAQAHAYTHTHARKRTHTLLAMYIESMKTEWRTQKVRQLPRRFNSAKAQRTLDTRPSRRWRTDARVQDRADADLDFSVQGGQRGGSLLLQVSGPVTAAELLRAVHHAARLLADASHICDVAQPMRCVVSLHTGCVVFVTHART